MPLAAAAAPPPPLDVFLVAPRALRRGPRVAAVWEALAEAFAGIGAGAGAG